MSVVERIKPETCQSFAGWTGEHGLGRQKKRSAFREKSTRKGRAERLRSEAGGFQHINRMAEFEETLQRIRE